MAKRINSQNSGAKIAVGVSLAALAAAAAGVAFLYGTDAGKRQRKNIKGWMFKARGEVLDKMEKMKDWSEQSYHDVVDSVIKRYEGIKNIDPVDVADLAQDLKRHWKNIKGQVDSHVKGKSKKKSR